MFFHPCKIFFVQQTVTYIHFDLLFPELKNAQTRFFVNLIWAIYISQVWFLRQENQFYRFLQPFSYITQYLKIPGGNHYLSFGWKFLILGGCRWFFDHIYCFICYFSISSANLNWDFTCFKRFNNCYILLLNSPQALENTGFIAGELFLIVSLVLYRPISVYELW